MIVQRRATVEQWYSFIEELEMPIQVSKKFDRGKANVVAKQLGKQEKLASDPFPGMVPKANQWIVQIRFSPSLSHLHLWVKPFIYI